MKYDLKKLFEVDESLNLAFDFKRMFLEGYKIIPKSSTKIILPVVTIFFAFGSFSIIGEFYTFLKKGYGLGIISFLAPLTLIGIAIGIYVGTAHYWFVRNQKALINNRNSVGLKKKYPDFIYRATARKELFDKMLSVLTARYYIPRIKFEYNYKTEHVDVSVADVTRTVSDNLSAGADRQDEFTAIFITIKGLKVDDVKFLNKEDVLVWLNEKANINLGELSEYKLILRSKENNVVLEFDDEITSPENKLKLLEYLKDEVTKNIKKEPESIDLNQVKILYNSNNETTIKNSFKLFEAAQWSLGEIINYVKENFTEDKYDLHFTSMLEVRKLVLGPVILTYYVYQDSAQGVEDTDYFYLHFYIDFEEKEHLYVKHDIEEKNIASDELLRPYYEKDEVPNFIPQMGAHFSEHTKQLDLTKKANVYAYLKDFYRQYVINNS